MVRRARPLNSLQDFVAGPLARFPLGWTTHSNGGRERVGEEVRDETGFNGSPPARGRRGRSRRRFTPADRPPIPRQPLGRRPVAPPAPPDRLLGTPTPGRRTSIRPRPRGRGTPPRLGTPATGCHARRGAPAGWDPRPSQDALEG